MLESADRLLRIEIAKEPHNAVFPATDFSLFTLPRAKKAASTLFRRIESIPVQNHTSLIVVRCPRAEKLKNLSYFAQLDLCPLLSWVDLVSLSYQRPQVTTSQSLSQMTELAALVHKGAIPNYAATRWFRDVPPFEDATNNWDLSPCEEESRPFVEFGSFSQDLGKLMLDLSTLQHRAFVYGMTPCKCLYSFLRTFQIAAYVFAPSVDHAMKWVGEYDEYR